MSIELLLYLIDLSSNFSILLFTILIVSITFVGISLMPFTDMDEEDQKKYINYYKKIGLLNIPIILFLILIPSEKTLYLITATHYGKKITENIQDNILIKKSSELILKKLDSYLMDNKHDH